MKTLYFLLGLIFTSVTFSQSVVSNASFENWTSTVVKDSVEFWATSTTDLIYTGANINNTYRVTGAQDGTYAIHMETQTWTDGMTTDTIVGYVLKERGDDDLFGFPYTDTINSLSGYYKCGVQTGDTALCIVELSKNHVVYAIGYYQFYGTQTSWTQFTLNIPNGHIGEPDSVFIGFVSSDPFTPGVATPGSWLEIDNVSFDFTTGSMTTPSPIPNHSFEDNVVTTLDTPDDWWSFDPIQYNFYQESYVKKSTDAASGTYALEVSMTASNDSTGLIPLVTNGSINLSTFDFEGGDLFWAQPDSLVGQVKYTPMGVDTAYALLEMWNASSGLIVYEIKAFVGLNTAYQEFSIPLSFTEAPDSMRLTFFAGDVVGSKLLIDDIQFIGGDVKVDELDDLSFNIYPNPASNQVTFEYHAAEYISIIDISGKTIYQEQLDQSGKLQLDINDWIPGVYFVNLTSPDDQITQKLVIR